MTSANPWSVKGVEPRTREAAKDLARREGLTLGEWLNRLVSDLEDETTMASPQQPYRDSGYRDRPVYSEQELPRGSYQLPPRPQREPDYARFSRESEVLAVTTALDQLAFRLQQSENRASHSISAIDDTVQTLGKRIDLTDRTGQAAIGRVDATLHDLLATQTALNERLRRMDEGDAQSKSVAALRALENALTRLATQVYNNEDRTDVALSQFDARMLAAQTRADATLDQIAQKVEATLSASVTGADEAARAVENRLAALENTNPEAAISEMRQALDRRMDGLTATLDGLLAKTRDDITREVDARSDARVSTMADDLRARLDASETRNAEALERVSTEVARAAEALDHRLRRVEHTDNDATLAVVRREITDISRTLDARLTLIEQRESAVVEQVSEQVALLGRKLDQRVIQSEERSAKAIEHVGDQMVKLAETMQSRQEQAVATLADRMRESDERAAQRMAEELARADLRAKEIATPLERSLDRLSDRVGRLETAGPTPVAETIAMDGFRGYQAETGAHESAPIEASFEHSFAPEPVPVQSALATKALAELPTWATDDTDAFSMGQSKPQESVSFVDPIFDDPFAEPITPGGASPSSMDAADEDMFVAELPVGETQNPFADALPAVPGTPNSGLDPFSGGFGDAGPARKSGRPDYLENARKAAEAAVVADVLRAEQKKTRKQPKGDAETGKSGVLTMALAGITGVAVLVGGYVLTRPKPTDTLVQIPAASPVVVAPAPKAALASSASAIAIEPTVAASTIQAALPAPAVPPAPKTATRAVEAIQAGAKPVPPKPIAPPTKSQPAPAPSMKAASTSMVPPKALPVAAKPVIVSTKAPSASAATPVSSASVASPARATANTTPAPTFARTPVASAARPLPTPTPSASSPAPATQTRSVSPPAAKPPELATPQAALTLADQRLRAGDKAGGAAAMLRAAELGAVSAQVRIARMFEKGEGVPVDLGKAKQWTQRAAEAGDRQAMHNLAVFFANGDGTGQDYAQAAKWFKDAAQRGVADSQFNLGALSEQGLGVRKDISEAFYWYTLAARQGDKDAAQRAAQLEGSMTPSARTAAKARADLVKTGG